MCGIAGIWNLARPDDSAGAVATMLDSMRHRGPDGRGTLSFGSGAAGMVRLALVDLSPRGQQPLWSADHRVAILFNGEIYNFRQERARLEQLGHVFRTQTDTEVILNLYLERGMEFVHRLRGMYVVALFDWRETSPDATPVLTLVRGPLGIKPLYLAEPAGDRRGVVFASEVRAMLASGLVPRRIDPQGLSDYLHHGFVLQPGTIIAGIRMLEPATWERYAPGASVRRERFWTMPASVPRRETLDEAAGRLRAALEESVSLHAMADAPVGAFLSGGVDSTGIVGLMRPHVSDLRTYTVKFPDAPGGDEADDAAAAARQYDCRHTTVEVTGREVADCLPRFAGELDQPSVDGFNTWVISRAAARDVKGVLSGVGGDEWFAGYPVVKRMARYQSTPLGRLQSLAGRVAHAVEEAVPEGKLRRKIDNLATRRTALATWLQPHSVFRDDEARRLSGASSNGDTPESRIAGLLDQVRGDWRNETPLGLACLLDTRVYMVDQLLRDSDAASMAHSLELRVPLVDLEIVAFARTCADEFKLNPDGGSGNQYQTSGSKRVLIHALADLLPSDLIRRAKRGFELPYAHWLRHDLAGLVAETCSPEATRSRGLLDPAAVAQTVQAAAGSHAELYPRLWSLVMLELWCRAVLDAPESNLPADVPLAVPGPSVG